MGRAPSVRPSCLDTVRNRVSNAGVGESARVSNDQISAPLDHRHDVKSSAAVLDGVPARTGEGRPMTPTTGKNPMGLRPIYRVGLAFVVVGVVVLIGLDLARPRHLKLKLRPGAPAKPVPQLRFSEGPP